jgi:hypothetical protein
MTKLGRVVTEQDLRNIPVTYEGNNYAPVLHSEAIDTVKEYLDKKNFKITDEKYLAASNGQRVIARYGIQFDNEFDYMIGFANSHDGSIAFKYYDGTILRTCSNGQIWSNGDMFKRKHVGNAGIDIISSIETKINSIEEVMKTNRKNVDRMKNIEIDKSVISKLIGEAYLYEDMIKAHQLSALKKELVEPSFDYGFSDNLYLLYSHFTHVIKESTPTDWIGQHREISDYFVNAAGILEKRGEFHRPALLLPEFEAEVIDALEGELTY